MAMSSLVPWAKGRPSETEETDLCSLFSDVIRRLTILKVEQDGTGWNRNRNSGFKALWISLDREDPEISRRLADASDAKYQA